MNEFCGSKVKLFLINSLSAEGVVESWDSSRVILISNNKKLVVNNPDQNIIMYYLIEESVAKQDASNNIKEIANKEDSNLDSVNSLTDLSLKFRKISELKMMAADVQREQIRKELTTFHSVNTDQILGKYGNPSFIKSQHDSAKKTNDGNAIDTRVLLEMSRKATE